MDTLRILRGEIRSYEENNKNIFRELAKVTKIVGFLEACNEKDSRILVLDIMIGTILRLAH